MSPPPWDGVLIFAFSRSGRDEERISYELTQTTKNVKSPASLPAPARRAERRVRFPSLKNACPPPPWDGVGSSI